MWSKKIFFKKQVSFQGVLTSLLSAIAECKKNKNLDNQVIATWNANICSCLRRCEMSSLIDVPYGIRTDDSKLVLGMVNTIKYGKISLVINTPRETPSYLYKMPYDTNIVGLLFEDSSVEIRNNLVIVYLYELLVKEVAYMKQ